jgi:hypothetical protein
MERGYEIILLELDLYFGGVGGGGILGRMGNRVIIYISQKIH